MFGSWGGEKKEEEGFPRDTTGEKQTGQANSFLKGMSMSSMSTMMTATTKDMGKMNMSSMMDAASGLAKQAEASATAMKKKAIEVAEAASNMDAMQQVEEDKREEKTVDTGRKMAITYVTERLIGLAFPYSSKSKAMTVEKQAEHLAAILHKAHQNHFMLWNLSEEQYDCALFGHQVQEHKFPGYPAPPLGMLFKICTAIEEWLTSEKENVAVIHCSTGKGRTATALACFLAWSGFGGGRYASPMATLEYVCKKKRGGDVERITIPSQRRYVRYFSRVLEGSVHTVQEIIFREHIYLPLMTQRM